MALRPIVKWGEPVLHAPVRARGGASTAPIPRSSRTWSRPCTPRPASAWPRPRSRVPLRVIVIDLSVGEDPEQLIKLVNPEFVEKEGEQREEEGCLSVPGYGGSPVRPARVTVKGLDPDGKERVYTGTELLARAFCHEIDHIDGLAVRRPPHAPEARPA